MTEKNDYIEQARETLTHVENPETWAEVQALLAIAQELRKLNVKLDEIIDGGPEYPGLRTYTTSLP